MGIPSCLIEEDSSAGYILDHHRAKYLKITLKKIYSTTSQRNIEETGTKMAEEGLQLAVKTIKETTDVTGGGNPLGGMQQGDKDW